MVTPTAELKNKGESPVGGDCYHTILTFDRQCNIMPIIGAMAIAPYGIMK